MFKNSAHYNNNNNNNVAFMAPNPGYQNPLKAPYNKSVDGST